ncbi:phytoene/squalene synthase family protein [Salisediminibacterium beveridgei]|uniref:Phytoene synthase n=1 Tax=Salisediminibacterium beveridgei TaxID=632773 RepID=A0A1D7QUR3_9BACI|nr:phytoene/squalene synthase family protein [Salisediminibacterium beveridgei]AOM82725.1 Phytoene synthase [Salisediminibacterium beveridgei]
MELREAYQECKTIIEHHSKTFAMAFRHLPREKREAVWAIYAFCRKADDIVDEGAHPVQELEVFGNDLDLFMSGSRPNDSALWIALEDSFQRFDFEPEPFYHMIQGQAMDLTKNRYQTVDELLDYSYHVASTVGLMLLPVLAPERKNELYDSAVSLGYGMQITNILRDIGEDLRRNRIYLPREVMARHDYTEQDLFNKIRDDRFISMWEELASLADHHYSLGIKELSLYPLNARLPVRAAAMFYSEILNAVRKNRYQVFDQRAFITTKEKERIIQESIK